jgi:type I restriction enzyme S subunit
MHTEDWPTVKLKDVFDLSSGKTKPDDLVNASDSKHPYPVYGGNGIMGYSGSSLLKNGAIIIGRVGAYCGTVRYVDQECWITDNAIYTNTINEDYDPRFLKELLSFKKLYRLRNKGGQPLISQKPIYNLRLSIPHKVEQIKIRETLSTWDKAISKTEKLIKAKKRYKKGLMQRLLSGKVRFSEFVKSEEVRKTRFGIYPKDWEYVKIQEVATQVKNKVGDETEGYTVMSCTKHDGLVSSLEYFDRQVFSKDISNYKAVEKGEFAYATNHVEEGSIGYNNWCEKGAISPMYTVFKADQDKIDNDYLYAILKTENYRRIFEIFTNGTVNRRGSLRWKDFRKIKVPVPALEEQKAISTVLKKAEQEIEILEGQLEKYQLQKKGLMQKLLTGKVRVQNMETV